MWNVDYYNIPYDLVYQNSLTELTTMIRKPPVETPWTETW
jgi:hypothetical protein